MPSSTMHTPGFTLLRAPFQLWWRAVEATLAPRSSFSSGSRRASQAFKRLKSTQLGPRPPPSLPTSRGF